VLLFQSRLATPEQPVRFPHSAHVGAQVDCLFCHRNAAVAANAGIPSVEQCMFCHSVVARGRPEVEKVRNAWSQQQTIQWRKVYQVPDHVHFVHEPHIRAGVQCAECHGEVQRMAVAQNVRSLKMGDCLSCHRQRGAPTECVVCHH